MDATDHHQSAKNLPKFRRDERLHVVRSKILMELLDVKQICIRFPGVTIMSIAQPFKVEGDSTTDSQITSMCQNFFDKKIEMIMTCNIMSIHYKWIEQKRLHLRRVKTIFFMCDKIFQHMS